MENHYAWKIQKPDFNIFTFIINCYHNMVINRYIYSLNEHINKRWFVKERKKTVNIISLSGLEN